MKLIRCTVTEGPRSGFKAIEVPSAEGYGEHFSIEVRFLKQEGDEFLLPVRVVGWDSVQKLSLIQLPVEADSGANRMWINDAIIHNVPDGAPV